MRSKVYIFLVGILVGGILTSSIYILYENKIEKNYLDKYMNNIEERNMNDIGMEPPPKPEEF